MQVQKDIPLKSYNTFGIAAKARFFCEINSEQDLVEALQFDEFEERFVLSGGSNMLITNDIDALVLHINLKGIETIEETNEDITLKVMAGENWHQMVLWTLEQNYGGLENMSLIPGNTGTAPIQNIGAYGVELKDVIVSCEAMDVKTQKIKTFTKQECQFGYRDSYFKNEGKGSYIITSVTFKLTKENHKLNTSYGAIEAKLNEMGIQKPTIQDISKAVIAIRQSKLPNPDVLGNSGSFFKNPVISKEQFEVFSKKHPEAPFYELENGNFKIPAGWLIESCGFKGKRFGDAGVHEKQALVLVNYGKASGKDIMDLAHRIMDKVSTSFHIDIYPEVNIIG
jgi:UDP-N-acetylmuramate dehydrogenase